MTEDRKVFENAKECIQWVRAGMAPNLLALKDQRMELVSKIRHVGPWRGSTSTLFFSGRNHWFFYPNHTSSTSDRPNQTTCSQRRPTSPRKRSITERWNPPGWCLLHTDWLNGSGQGLHIWNLDRSFLLIWSNEHRQRGSVRTPAICGSSVGLWPTLPRQVNTTSEDSSFSCHPVFSSPSQFPTAVGASPNPHSSPPSSIWKPHLGFQN